MNTETNQVAAGAFVVLLTIAIILGIVWLSSGFLFMDLATYEVDMQESVSGLSVDAVVEFNGVNVGKVKSVKIDKQHPRLVQILLAVHKDTPITKGTSARISSRGLTGISYISLKDKEENTQPLSVMPGHKWPMIPVQPMANMQMDEALAKMTENVTAVSKAIEALLSNENLQQTREILKNMNIFSANLIQDNRRMIQILNNTMEASRQFPGLMTNLNRTFSNFSRISDEISQNPALLVRGRAQSPGPGE